MLLQKFSSLDFVFQGAKGNLMMVSLMLSLVLATVTVALSQLSADLDDMSRACHQLYTASTIRHLLLVA